MPAPAQPAPWSDAAPVRRLHSLQPSHLEVARAELAAWAPGCSVDGHDDYDGNMMIVFLPDGSLDSDRSYILVATQSGIEAALVSEDRIETYGVFPTLIEAIACLKQSITLTQQPSQVRVA